MKVLLDTNIWISGLLWGGNQRKIIQLAQQKQIFIYSSKLLIEELQATLAYPKLQRRLVEVSRITRLCQPISLSTVPELRDPKDKIVLETALSVPVDVIVSGDEDLLVLGEFQEIPIVTTKQLLENYSV